MGIRLSLAILSFFTTLEVSRAEVRVEIFPPELVNIGDVVEDLISQQEISLLVNEPLTIYEDEIAGQLRGALGRPALYQGLSDAITLPLLALARPAWESSQFSLVVAVGAGVQSDSFDPAVWADRMKTLQPEADYRFGAAAQPLSVAASWDLVPGEWSWSVGVLGAYSQVSYAPVTLATSAAGASTHFGYHPDAAWGPFSWSGVTLSLGGGWSRNRFDTEVTVALPNREVPLDLTYIANAGSVIITATPRIELSLVNQGTFWPVQVSTEVALGRVLRLGASVGAVWGQATSTLALKGRNPVHVATKPQGEDPDLIYERFFGDTAWVEVEGSESGSVAPGWQPVVSLTPSWSLGAFRFGLPLTYRHPGGLSAVLAWGVSL